MSRWGRRGVGSFWRWTTYREAKTAGAVAMAVVATTCAAQLTYYGINFSVGGLGFCTEDETLSYPRGQKVPLRYLPCATNFRGEATSVPDRVVSFWTKVDNCVVPIGFGYVVAGGVLLCRHQAKGDKSMEELQAAGFPLYVGRAELSVSTIDRLYPFRLGEVVAPPKTKAAHEISRDFAFMKSDIASKLGFKTRSLQFGFRNNAAFETFHYRYDDGKLAFVLIRNVGSLTGPLDGVKGVYCHGVDTKPGDSGSPMLTVGTGEIVGMRCGILTNDESLITHRLAVGSRQIYSHMRRARMIAGKKGGILESCLLPQIGVDVYVKCSKKAQTGGNEWSSSNMEDDDQEDDFDDDDWDDYDRSIPDEMFEGADAIDEMQLEEWDIEDELGQEYLNEYCMTDREFERRREEQEGAGEKNTVQFGRDRRHGPRYGPSSSGEAEARSVAESILEIVRSSPVRINLETAVPDEIKVSEPKVPPAVQGINFGDDQNRQATTIEVEQRGVAAPELPPVKHLGICGCGTATTASYGCPKCEGKFRPVRAQRFTDKAWRRSEELMAKAFAAVPLSPFEEKIYAEEYCVPTEMKPFEKDSKGEDFLFVVGKTAKPPSYGKKADHDDSAAVEAALKEIGLDIKLIWPDADESAVEHSLRANCLKRTEDKFTATTEELSAMNLLGKARIEPPDLENPASINREVEKAMGSLRPGQSAGYDGYIRGRSTKGEFERAFHDELVTATTNRLRRLAFLGSNAGYLHPIHKFRLGLKTLVNPQIKREWHRYEKFFEADAEGNIKRDADGRPVPRKNPRWRSILIQGTIDFLTLVVLVSKYTKGWTRAFQESGGKSALQFGSGVGFSASPEGKKQMASLLQAMSKASPSGMMRSSDVTGMDWSVGPSGLVHTYRVWLEAGAPENQWARMLWAFGYCELDSLYLLGSRIIAQRHIGVVGSGSFRTTWLDLDNRAFWMNMTCGYQEGKQVFRPAATSSPLVERSIRFTSHGEKNDFCGRLWDPSTGEYELTNWMAALARACQGFVEVAKQPAPTEEDVEVIGQRLASLTYEMSGHPIARDKLEALVNKYAYLFDDIQWKRISDCVRSGLDRTNEIKPWDDAPDGM